VKYLHVQLSDPKKDGEYDLRVWRAQPRAFQRRLLRVSLDALTGDLVDIPAAPIEDALDLLQSAQPNSTYHLPHDVELCIGQDRFVLRLKAAHSRVRPRAENTWEV